MSSPRLERIAHGGWSNNLRLSNGDVELVVTLDVGPRVLRYAPVGGRNALGAIQGDLGGAGEETFRLRGGHRLWVSPEEPARTYVPDNGPVREEGTATGVRLTTPADPTFRLEKSLELSLAATGSEVRLVHRVRNLAETETELSVWALTVLARRGMAVVPLPIPVRRPEDGPKTAADFAPSYTVSLWPYFSFSDPRVTFGRRFVRVRQEPALSSTKLGLAHRPGWAAYWNEGLLFVKRFEHLEEARYPDGGCNFECYTDTDILELETLSPLTRLSPGDEISHVETWSLHDGVPAPVDDEATWAEFTTRLPSPPHG